MQREVFWLRKGGNGLKLLFFRGASENVVPVGIKLRMPLSEQEKIEKIHFARKNSPSGKQNLREGEVDITTEAAKR